MPCFSGRIFVDGSCDAFWYRPGMNRAGWSAVQVDDEGAELGGMYGTVPGQQQDIPRAELYAIRAVVPMILPPATVHVDHKNHVDANLRGRAWRTTAKRPNADLWRAIWFHLEDVGVGSSRKLRTRRRLGARGASETISPIA